MSTRSGKRIHTSFNENATAVEEEPAVKSERKTRSKRVKENLEELSVSLFKNKKRNNYVSYPTDDELLGNKTTRKDDDTKPSRVLRKSVIREQNLVENNENLEAPAGSKSLIRKSRRGKRLDDAEDAENQENVPADITELYKSKKSKKKKKNCTIIENPPPVEEEPVKKPKKKKKKGKKTSSIIVEDVLQDDNLKTITLNKSIMSIDSFHSATGSPIQNQDITNEECNNKVNTTLKNNVIEEINKSASKTKKKLSVKNSFDKNYMSLIVSMNDEKGRDTSDDVSEKRKSVSKDTLFDQCYVSLSKDNLEKHLDNFLNVSNLSNGQLKRRKSNTKEATFNKSNTAQEDEESNLNISNVSNKQSKRRKSNVNDVTLTENIAVVDDIERKDTPNKGLKKRSSIVKDATFDKSNASITKDIVENDIENDLNISDKQLKVRRSVVKDTTFDRSGASLIKDSDCNSSNISNKQLKVKKSVSKDNTYDKSNVTITDENNAEKDAEPELNVSNMSNKQLRRTRSSLKDSTFDKSDQLINTTYEKATLSIDKGDEKKKDSTFDKSNNKNLNATYEKDIESDYMGTSTAKGKEKECSGNTTYDKTDKSNDTTFDRDNTSTSFDAFKKGAMTRKSSIKDATFDKSNISLASLSKEDFEKDSNMVSSSAMKRKSIIRRQTFGNYDAGHENINTTFEKTSFTENEPKRKSPRISQTADIQHKLNTTFEKETNENEKPTCEPKSSLISSDNSSISNKSDISRISITSDDTTENIINTTPVLIESSMDESHISKQESPKPQTPLKREGTFTKEDPEEQIENELVTPSKRKSLPAAAAGCTPYYVSKSSQKKTMLNVTRSIEKGVRTSVEPAPRMTRVMFCSPVDNPVLATQEKRKIIKSNLKGSNKSFVFDDSVSVSRPGRKRSYTHSDIDDARVKRTRLTEDLQQSVDRLSRPRTTSATAKLSVTTPSTKPPTPSKPKSDAKVSRTKLPNFAALHQKQFSKMESLNECQERRAKRAKQLLTPTAPPGLLERISPKNNTDSPKAKEPAKPKEKPDPKTDTPTKKLPTLESLRPGFTRFGFKLNLDVNPFSIPSKTEKLKEKPVEKPNGIAPRPAILPSLAGATSVRREAAKLTVMREKSFTDKRNVNRNANRTIIKGVRTNRRFELQMKLRNID